MFKKRLFQTAGIENVRRQTQPKIKRLINTHFNNNNIPHSHSMINNGLSDAEGLTKAYESPGKIHIDGNKMYISGTTPTPLGDDLISTATNTRNWIQDWSDDFTKVPLGLTSLSERYQQAQQALSENPQVDTLVGHSLGGSVVLELNKNYGDKFRTTTYSAPVFDLFQNDTVNDNHLRFRTKGDIIASMDNNAITINKNTLNPLELHAYNNYGDTGKDTGIQIM